MNACLRYAPIIGSREGELSAEDSRALAVHLADCPSCGAMAAEVAATEGLLRDALLAKANARDFGPFVDQIMARVEAPETRRRRPRGWTAGLAVLRARWRWFTLGTIAVVVAVSAFMYVHHEEAMPEQLAALEIDLEGGSTVLQTADGPVVLLEPDDSGLRRSAREAGPDMIRSILRGLALALALLFAAPVSADVPVHLRIIKGSKKGPAKMDAALVPLKRQLAALAYVRWELADDQQRTMVKGKLETVKLPNGDEVSITMSDESEAKVTFEVTLAARKTQSRLTVERGQRIVHQVSGEKDGSAFFLTVIAWPESEKAP